MKDGKKLKTSSKKNLIVNQYIYEKYLKSKLNPIMEK